MCAFKKGFAVMNGIVAGAIATKDAVLATPAVTVDAAKYTGSAIGSFFSGMAHAYRVRTGKVVLLSHEGSK